jgi:hypothetical protein
VYADRLFEGLSAQTELWGGAPGARGGERSPSTAQAALAERPTVLVAPVTARSERSPHWSVVPTSPWRAADGHRHHFAKDLKEDRIFKRRFFLFMAPEHGKYLDACVCH